MLRLALVFTVWMCSTAYALEDEEWTAASSQEAELHQVYKIVWSAADPDHKLLLDRAQRAWLEYRAYNCEIFGEDCFAVMADERTAEPRLILTNTNVRTILPADGCADDHDDHDDHY